MESPEDNATTEPGEPLEMSEEIAELFENLQRERDDAVEARTRALADYANFQRRARENETREREMGIAQVTRSLMPVLDQFDLALGQDEGDVRDVEHREQHRHREGRRRAKLLRRVRAAEVARRAREAKGDREVDAQRGGAVGRCD